MNFLSWQFALFLALAAAAAYRLPGRWRAVWLLAASAFFYLTWGADHLALLAVCGLAGYAGGRGMQPAEGRARQAWLALGLAVPLGLLALFKYFDFLAGAAEDLLGLAGMAWRLPRLGLALPAGISFYTFLLAGYLLDVYRRRVQPETGVSVFALFVSFFPPLIAGPIGRAGRMLPQFQAGRQALPVEMTAGLRLILWGVFKKLVIADRLSLYVNAVYSQPAGAHPLQVLLATYFFAFQIYCDFSAYSDIAIGAARLLGFDLMQNFRRPYLATSIQEFWGRWHISLTTWFRDYLYLPAVRARMAGGGDPARLKLTDYHIVLIFLLSGLWHGAGWTFILWGGLHGLYLLAANWRAALSVRLGRAAQPPQGWRRALAMLLTFHLVLLTWVFFRAASVGEAAMLIGSLTDWSGFPGLDVILGPLGAAGFALALAGVALLFAVEIWIERRGAADFDDALAGLGAPARWAAYYGLAALTLLFGVFAESTFIYFQF
ncbi:MAG: MBOAT family protein [Chloroflexi bacterium]|nr:MBOAT family protein [Chloroflexota bacterium]